MTAFIDLIHAAVGFIVDAVVSTLGKLGPSAGLILISIVLGVVLVVLYGKLSRQAAIKDAKRRIHGALLESILFRHHTGLSLKAQGSMFLQGGRYFLLAVPPLVILAIPCLIVLAQLARWYDHRPLRPSEDAIVRLELAAPAELMTSSLSGDGLEVTPPVRVSGSNEIYWRVRPTGAAAPLATLRTASGEFSQPLFVGSGLTPIVSGVYAPWWERLLYPATGVRGALPASVRAFEVEYPESNIRLFGMKLHWLVVFFVVSLVSGLVGAKLLGVEV